MKLQGIVEVLKGEGLLIETNGFDSNLDIIDITFNSKEVKEGYLFICKGEHFKPEYLDEAISNGAVAYMSEKEYEVGSTVCGLIVNSIRKAMAVVASCFYGYPSEKLRIIAFTGTKGKTTSTHMMKFVVDDYMNSCGKRPCALVSTIETFDGVETVENFNTTPEAVELQRSLKRCVDNGVEFCSLEVSSQGLRYARTDNTNFEVAVFLNISKDHISPSEHKDFEDYFSAKLKIFSQCQIGIVNLDADHHERILEQAKNDSAKYVKTYSLHNPNADYYCYEFKKDGKYTRFNVKHQDFDESFLIKLHGFYNVSNALAIIASAYELNIPLENIKNGIKNTEVSGRMEIFESKDGKVVAVVDYAHNKISYESLFKAMSDDYPEHSKNIKIIYGSVGDKAQERREELGTITGQKAAMSYISADYPGHESFQKISEEIAHYVELQGGKYKIMENRNEAIEEAISTATEPTIVMACGFGRLNWQKYGDIYYPRESDVECVIRCLNDYDKKHEQ